MNNQSINKIKMFSMGLCGRFEENSDIFKRITVEYKAGLKTFKGTGLFEDNKISYNYNGKTDVMTINEVLDKIANECEKYDSLELTYTERGSSIIISADNKNVKTRTVEEKQDESEDDKSSNNNHMGKATSTLLNRNYYIKTGKADSLLKEINIMSKDGKIKNDKIRKYNQIDHYVELLDGMLDNLAKNEVLTVLDCGCGKSYLSFVLNYYLTEVKKRKCRFIGIDISEGVIESSKKMARNLGYRNMEFHAMDIKNYAPDKKINLVLSLHACDTATDMALALGIKVDADAIIAVPCCHRELLSQYSFKEVEPVTKYGILKARMADALTDGMRGLMLEAKGYDVSIVEYISPLETPKNLMIKAFKGENSKEKPELMDEYIRMMSMLNAYPALYRFLNEGWSAY